MNCAGMNSSEGEAGIHSCLLMGHVSFSAAGPDLSNERDASLPPLLNHLFLTVILHTLEKLKHFLVVDSLNVSPDWLLKRFPLRGLTAITTRLLILIAACKQSSI